MEIITRKPTQRVDPKHPESTDPNFERDRRRGEANWGNMQKKFENDAEKRDYLRAVASNPGNVLGVPPFYPPLRIAPQYVGSFVEISTLEKLRWLEKEAQYEFPLFCGTCDALTTHVVAATYSYCRKCGYQKPYRSVA